MTKMTNLPRAEYRFDSVHKGAFPRPVGPVNNRRLTKNVEGRLGSCASKPLEAYRLQPHCPSRLAEMSVIAIESISAGLRGS